MPTETVSVEWMRDQVFLLRDRAGFPILMTQPYGVNGADLLPLSVAGCASWDIVAILQKQHQKLTGMSVSIESVRDDTPPWRFRQIRIHYHLSGHGLTREAVRRAVELSENKYCSTFATLRAAVELSSDFEIIEDGDGQAGGND